MQGAQKIMMTEHVGLFFKKKKRAFINCSARQLKYISEYVMQNISNSDE
jgi:hypothetical protein